MVVQPALEPLRRWDPERIGPTCCWAASGPGRWAGCPRPVHGRPPGRGQDDQDRVRRGGRVPGPVRARGGRGPAGQRRVHRRGRRGRPRGGHAVAGHGLRARTLAEPAGAACGPLPVPAARWLAAGCAEALESIHGAGLVHRDLKPSNVLVSPDGPRVIDFGVARAAERIQLTVTRGAVGTPAYMAPEQARDTRQASAASDMFSLGATLLFAATGHAPYQGETVMDVLVRLATEPPDLAGLPAELAGPGHRVPGTQPPAAAQLGGLLASSGRSSPGPRRARAPRLPARPGDGADRRRTSAARQLRPRRRPGRGRPRAGAAGGDGPPGAATLVPRLQRTRARDGAGRRLAAGGRSLPRAAAWALPARLPGRQRRWGRRLGAAAGPPAGPDGGTGSSQRAARGTALAGSPAAPVARGLPAQPARRLVPRPPPPSARRQSRRAPRSAIARRAQTSGIEMLQPIGDGATGFLVHGSGLGPRSPVTVTLAGRRAPAVRWTIAREPSTTR